MSVKQVVSGFYLHAKVQVATKVIEAKEHWHLWAATNGLPSATILEASRKERELFGVLQKHPKVEKKFVFFCLLISSFLGSLRGSP